MSGLLAGDRSIAAELACSQYRVPFGGYPEFVFGHFDEHVIANALIEDKVDSGRLFTPTQCAGNALVTISKKN